MESEVRLRPRPIRGIVHGGAGRHHRWPAPLEPIVRASTVVFALVLAAGGSGCVVKYGAAGPGGADPTAAAATPPVQLNDETRALKRILDSTELIDQQDRIHAALALAAQVQAEPARSAAHVEAYLQGLAAIEQRGLPSAVPLPEAAAGATSFGASDVKEAELDDQGAAAPTPVQPAPVALFDPDAPKAVAPAGPNGSALRAAAQARFAADDFVGAMGILEACRGLSCWAEVNADYAQARDAEVFRQKELLAQRFLGLRGEANVERQRDGLLAIAAELSSLRAKYPESVHAADLGKHIERVQRELEALPEQ